MSGDHAAEVNVRVDGYRAAVKAVSRVPDGNGSDASCPVHSSIVAVTEKRLCVPLGEDLAVSEATTGNITVEP